MTRAAPPDGKIASGAPGAFAAARTRPRVAYGSNLASSALALRLAAGEGGAAAEVRDWSLLFALSSRERLAVLAWLRSGESIRRAAPAPITAAWRSLWAASTTRAHRAVHAYAETADLLARHGVRAVALKGAPLALSLYGDHGARCSDDVDCFIAPADRELAGSLLRQAGWRSEGGTAPYDETFCRPGESEHVRLEVHSALVSDRLLHLPVPFPQARWTTVAGRSLWVHDGPFVPAFLAAHLATHFAPPLLWWLDFHLVWEALDTSARGEALGEASRAGLRRYLDWAIGRGRAVQEALAGDVTALRRLGVTEEGRRDRHELWRHLSLAPDGAAAIRALSAWAWPRWAPEQEGSLAVGLLRRVARHWRLLRPSSRPWQPPAGSVARAGRDVPSLQESRASGKLDGPSLLAVAREVTSFGGELTVRLTGQSMVPAMAPGDRLTLGPLPRQLRRGCIVLIDLEGRPVIHRISEVGEKALRAARAMPAEGSPAWSTRGRGDPREVWIRTRGDACTSHDAPVPVVAAVACVIASERAGLRSAHGFTLRFGIAAAVRGLWWRVRAPLAHLWRHWKPRPAVQRAAPRPSALGRR